MRRDFLVKVCVRRYRGQYVEARVRGAHRQALEESFAAEFGSVRDWLRFCAIAIQDAAKQRFKSIQPPPPSP